MSEVILGIIGLAFMFFAIRFLYKLIKGLFKSSLILFSKMMYLLNTLSIGLLAFVGIYTLLETRVKYSIFIGLTVGLIVFGVINYYGHSYENPKLTYILHVLFGIADGVFVGNMIKDLWLEKHFEIVPSVYTLSVYIFSIIAMVVLSFYERRSASYYID